MNTTNLKKPALHTYHAAGLVEYGMLVGLIAVVAIGAVSILGDKVAAVFNKVATELSSSVGVSSAPAETPDPVLAAITMVPGDRGSFAGEIGWSQSSVDLDVGTVTSNTNGGYGIVTLYTQSFNMEMRLYLAGDVSGDDFTGVEMTCSNGARSYSLASANNFTADYRPADNATFWLWTGLDAPFVVGEEVSCTIQ